jgi:hypothetical protein
LLLLIAFFAEILPILFYLIFLKRNRGEGLWVIFLYCLLSFLTEILFYILRQQNVYSGFIIVQFTLFSWFFYSSLQEKKFKYIPIIGALIFYGVAISNFTSKRFDSLSASVESILIIPYCILLLYEQIKDPSIIFVYNNKKFWVIIAILLYFSATLFLYLYYSNLSVKERSNYWLINNFFEILKNILFSVAFIMKKNVQRSDLTDIDMLDPDI